MQYFYDAYLIISNNGVRPNTTLPSFEVQCQFGNNEAFTVISVAIQPKDGFIFPQKQSEKCSEPECFQKVITYTPDFKQIEVYQYQFF